MVICGSKTPWPLGSSGKAVHKSLSPPQGSQAGLLGRAGPKGARLPFLFSGNVYLNSCKHLQHPRKSCRAKSCDFMSASEHKQRRLV